MKFLMQITLVSLLFFAQCSGADNTSETGESTTTTTPEEAPLTPQQQADLIDNSNVSPSEILEKNEAAYAALHQTVSSQLDEILQEVAASSYKDVMKEGLKTSFEEVAKYDNIYDIAKTSKYTSAETIEQFMKSLQMQLKMLRME